MCSPFPVPLPAFENRGASRSFILALRYNIDVPYSWFQRKRETANGAHV